MYNRFNSSNILSNSPLKTNNQNISYTLPVTCHICLGKVKEPSVCPNLHVFCSFCIEIWLEKTKQCPTCRIQINKENPCRRILGGVENFDDADALKPCEFSNEAVRKARYLNLFEQYEEEIVRLNKYIDSLNSDISKLKEANNSCTSFNNMSTSPQHDMMQILKDKLKTLQTTHDETVKERDRLKETNKKLESENSILIQDILRLKSSLNERNSQLSSKYTLAALESKLDSYEKEIKQLQKALEKSDKYIAELETKQRDKENGGTHNNSCILKENSIGSFSNLTSSSNNIYASQLTMNLNDKLTAPTTTESNINLSSVKNLKGDNHTSRNDLKIVKFSEKIDKIPISSTSSTISMVTSPIKPTTDHTYHKSASIQPVIPKDNFYGSPSKLNNLIGTQTSSSIGIMSFSERLKKNNISSSINDLEATSNILNHDITNNNNNNNNNNSHQFLFSPLKRLRLDEVNNSVDNNNLKSQTTQQPHHLTPFNHNYKNKLKSVNEFEDYHVLDKKLVTDSATNSDFKECIELLNKAEQKVQNRQYSPNKTSPTSEKSPVNNSTSQIQPSSSFGLPDKYFRAVNILENAGTELIDNKLNSVNQLTLTKSLLATYGSNTTSSGSSSSSNSANSLSAVVSSASYSSNSSSCHNFSNSNNGSILPNNHNSSSQTK